MTRILPRLRDIAEDYDALLCDVWGVIHNGRKAFAEAVEALCAFRQQRGPVILLTNAPRPSAEIPRQLERLGVNAAAYDAIVTSGDATRSEIEARAPGPAYMLGPDRDEPLLDGLRLDRAPALGAAKFILCTGLENDETERPEDYRELLSQAQARDLEMVCANPDLVVRRGDRLIPCGGALAQIYERLGGRVVYAGKPHPPIYQQAFDRLGAIAGREIPRRRILALGDGIETDIAGAARQGLDAVFIAAGIHGAAARGRDGRLDPAGLVRLFGPYEQNIIGAMEELAW
ncbi:MAG: TIGR01459 family HAD-type hydrolase [Parvularculaceae bacterium]